MIYPRPEVAVQSADAERRLYVMGLKAQNLRVPLTQIKNLMVADHVRNFQSGGSLFGGWDPTQSGGPPLVESGLLAKELSRKSGPGKSVKKYEVRVGVGGDKDGFGGDTFYARFHQAGASNRRGKDGTYKGELPKREVVGITDRTQTTAVEIIRQYITR